MKHKFRFIGECEGEKFFLGKDESHHAKSVLRLKPGAEIEILTTQGIFAGVMTADDSSIVEGNIEHKLEGQNVFEVSIGLSCTRKSQFEKLLPSIIEVGVKNIFFYDYKSSSADKAKINLERAQKIIFEAVKQSKSSRIPKLELISSLPKLISRFKHTCVFIEPNHGLDILDTNSLPDDALLVVGPEFGFDAEFVTELKSMESVELLTLPVNVLKVSTACVAALSWHRSLTHRKLQIPRC